MTVTLDKVVPWGRSLHEYRSMFALTDADLERNIVGCADGPASFNAEVTAWGGQVTSCDPIYAFTSADIRQRISESSAQIVEYARQNLDEFNWSSELPNPDALAAHRARTMECFLIDFDAATSEQRYLPVPLPELSFSPDTFDLAVSSHFLFLYSEHLGQSFHIDAIRNMLHVAREVRIFPLLELGGERSRYVEEVTTALRAASYCVNFVTVEYEFQRGANQMMKVTR